MTATMLPEAEFDLENAHDYYEGKRLGLGSEFVHEYRRGVDRILDNRNRGHQWITSTTVTDCIDSRTESCIAIRALPMK